MPCGRWRVNHLTAIAPKKSRTAPESTAWGGRENLTRNRRLTKCHYGAEGRADTVLLGAYRREALEAAGGFDETLLRNRAWTAGLLSRCCLSGSGRWTCARSALRHCCRGRQGEHVQLGREVQVRQARAVAAGGTGTVGGVASRHFRGSAPPSRGFPRCCRNSRQISPMLALNAHRYRFRHRISCPGFLDSVLSDPVREVGGCRVVALGDELLR